MTKRQGNEELPVTAIELEYGISAGIHLASIGGAEMVPIQEEHEARLERGIGLAEWSSMDLFEKALVIAVRRNRIAMQNIQTEAEIAKSKREAGKAGRKR